MAAIVSTETVSQERSDGLSAAGKGALAMPSARPSSWGGLESAPPTSSVCVPTFTTCGHWPRCSVAPARPRPSPPSSAQSSSNTSAHAWRAAFARRCTSCAERRSPLLITPIAAATPAAWLGLWIALPVATTWPRCTRKEREMSTIRPRRSGSLAPAPPRRTYPRWTARECLRSRAAAEWTWTIVEHGQRRNTRARATGS
mmetsp:Transcript_29863/g.85187  ORF Transcript_29863/g.85187 Transcript_29863/m.85187 type:complete len:200 (+) Transcript_29863:729-1328(+)